MDNEQENFIAEYDQATAELLAGLDAAHIALANLQAIKQRISTRVSELGLIDSAGKDGPGKNLAKAIEAGVIIPVSNPATIHKQIETARILLLGNNPDLAKLEAAGLAVGEWSAEFNGSKLIVR